MHGGHLRGRQTVILRLFSIIVPEANLKDLERIDQELRKQAVFYGVREIKEVLAIAFPTLLDKPAPKL
jgi:ATP-dependent Lon protease